MTVMVRIHLQVDDELHRQAKIGAATLGITLREFVVQALAEKIERGRQKP